MTRCCLPHLPERDEEPSEVAHQSITSSELAVGACDGPHGQRQQAVRTAAMTPSGDADDDDDQVPVLVVADPDGGEDQQPAEGQRDEHLPAEVHELVVAEAGQRGPEPDEA